jgi:hypothetical protein
MISPIRYYLANIADGVGRGGRIGRRPGEERDPLVLSGELVGGVDGVVAAPTERRLVSAAQHRRLRPLAHVALDLHLSLESQAIFHWRRESVERRKRRKRDILLNLINKIYKYNIFI